MKSVTILFKRQKDYLHVVQFQAAVEHPNNFVSGITINRMALPSGVREIKLTMNVPEGGRDEAYNTLK